MKKSVFLITLSLSGLFFLSTSCQKKSNGVKMALTLECSPKEMLHSLCSATESIEFIKTGVITDSLISTGSIPYFELFVQTWEKHFPTTPISPYFMDYRGTDNNILLNFLNSEYDKKISETKSILKKRLESYGIEEFLFKDTLTRGTFLIEISGVEKPEEIKQLMTNKCRIEFFETYDNAQIFDFLLKADQIILDSFPIPTEQLHKDSIVSLLDTQQETEDENLTPEQDSVYLKFPFTSRLYLNTRQDENGTTIIENGPVAGRSQIKDTAMVNQMLDYLFSQKYPIFPRNLNFMWTAKPGDGQNEILSLVAVKHSYGVPAMDGRNIVDASVSQNNGMHEIGLKFNANGAHEFKKLTSENISKSIAIVIDGKVFAYPNVISEIAGGECMISGNFTKEEAEMLTSMIKSGSIPLDIKIKSEKIIKGN